MLLQRLQCMSMCMAQHALGHLSTAGGAAATFTHAAYIVYMLLQRLQCMSMCMARHDAGNAQCRT
jgi:hypothetical protein